MTNTKSTKTKKSETNKFYGFIYITTNTINGKKYIGQKKYYGNYKSYLGSGIILQKAIAKYGKENFKKEIIEQCKTKDELNEREKYWIKFYNATESDDFYNITNGGEGGFGSGVNSPWYGKHLSPETIKKLSQSKIGDKNPFYGKTHSDEAKRKISQSSSNHKHSEDTKAKMSKSIKANHTDFSGSKNPNAKPIIQYDLNGIFIKYWDCAKEAAKTLNLDYSSIRYCCSKRYKTAGGYIWRYANNTDL